MVDGVGTYMASLRPAVAAIPAVIKSFNSNAPTSSKSLKPYIFLSHNSELFCVYIQYVRADKESVLCVQYVSLQR